ncbi:sulfatase-like hydrolase/transferase [Bacteroides thetaiotaomicron]|jgi:arylsulfatase A-like enzyme|uniref:sulfatase-like hydrolase/transferase n=1 Tax=Bacteroides thetaiotaomicron TaxID=818 RepID=UPI0040644F65
MKNLNLTFYAFAGISSMPVTLLAGQFQPEKKSIDKQHPNVVLIVADDLGYGDLSCYGADAIQTPGMDRIANEGIRFTRGFCTAATSTPSRYSVMTGKYPWTNPDAKILPGNAALIIDTSAITLPKVMKQAGYVTGSVGKWHIGLGDGNVDWNERVYPGASEIGYDYSFIQAATNDRVPCVFLENNIVVGLDPNDPLYVDYRKNFSGEPTGKDNPELLRMHPSVGHAGSIVNGVPRIGFQKGGKTAQWRDEDMAELFLEKAKAFVEENKDHPFFLYYGLHQPHVPRVPNERFIGKSGMGARGDVILEADWCVNEFLKVLDTLGLTENTIVILTSDNGPVLDDGYKDQAVELVGEHRPAGLLRGWKTTMYDGGVRIPFMLRWPAVVKPKVSDAFVCQMDLLASFASLLGQSYPDKLDSQNTLKAFLGKSRKGREGLVIEGMFNYAYRKGDWALIPPYRKEKVYKLYNLKNDIGQQYDVADKYPQKVRELIKEFESLKQYTGKRTKFQ